MTTDTEKQIAMALSDAYEKGWCAAAQWANRDDLRHDTDSTAYAVQRDSILAGKAGKLIASLCGDVEPVAWAVFADNGNVRFWTTDEQRAQSTIAEFGGTCEPIFRASTVATLKARVAELEKDAARYQHIRSNYLPPVSPSTWDALDEALALGGKELDAAIDAALSAAPQPQQEQSK